VSFVCVDMRLFVDIDVCVSFWTYIGLFRVCGFAFLLLDICRSLLDIYRSLLDIYRSLLHMYRSLLCCLARVLQVDILKSWLYVLCKHTLQHTLQHTQVGSIVCVCCSMCCSLCCRVCCSFGCSMCCSMCPPHAAACVAM